MVNGILIISFIIYFFGNIKENEAIFIKTDCNDNDLNAMCQCAFDDTQDYLIMVCQSILDSSMSKLPPLSASVIRIVNTFDHWPAIPTQTKNTLALFLSENQIDSIGSLENIEQLQYLNLSHNLIKKVDSSLSTLKELYFLDLSNNLLEEFRFENVVPNLDQTTYISTNDQIFSKLRILILSANKIKQVFNFDLLFTSMPICNVVVFDVNSLTYVDVPSLSNHSINVISKIKQALAKNSSYLDSLNTLSSNGYYFGLNVNSITRVNINFRDILNEVFSPYKVMFLAKFLAISIVSESTKVICDCNTFLNMNFLIEQLSMVFSNEKIPEGDMENFVCFKQDSDVPFNLFTMINQNAIKSSDFCDSQSLITASGSSLSTENNKISRPPTSSAKPNNPTSFSNINHSFSYFTYLFSFLILCIF